MVRNEIGYADILAAYRKSRAKVERMIRAIDCAGAEVMTEAFIKHPLAQAIAERLFNALEPSVATRIFDKVTAPANAAVVEKPAD